ncbi:hypothetical protein CMI47_13760 [Candidatus Pacearchaeota archaeon]|nr:hypothetical protein [Candidatus Pacearchaeota archaeon]
MKINSLVRELKRIIDKKEELRSLIDNHDHIIIIGNGGSNSVASHIAQDYTKMLGKRAVSFSDPSRLTCYINDYGRDEAYKKFIEHFEEPNTLVILISSSGRSENILTAGRYCEEKHIPTCVLSGFYKDNPLNEMKSPEISYHVDSHDYGVVESAHQVFLHSILMDDDSKGIIAGTFDIIHPGYIRMFKDAKHHCEHLTVALHIDPSTERDYKIKPVQTAEERTEILLGMENVDSVVTYTKESEFHEYLKSGDYHIRFLGTDYMTKKYTGSDIPITIVWLDRDHDYSTTKIKKMIYQSVSDMDGQEFE